jgi:hypothetical protein
MVPLFLWTSFALQAKRIRDIGWNPLYVIAGWIAAGVLDRIVVMITPSLEFDHLHQSAVGLSINLLMVGCLLFWPGGDFDAEERDREEAATPSQDHLQRAAAQPAARVMGSVRGATRPGFGRRGL